MKTDNNKPTSNDVESQKAGEVGHKLIDCPFCGEQKSLIFHNAEDYASGLSGIAVMCSIYNEGCGATSTYSDSKEKAAKFWNKRYKICQ